PFPGLPDRATDGVTLAQPVLLDHGEGDVDVVGSGQETTRPDEGVVVEDVEDPSDRDEDVVLADDRLGVRALPSTPVTVAVAGPTTPAPTAFLLLTVLTAALPLSGLAALVTSVVTGVTGVLAIAAVTLVAAVGFSLLGGRPLARRGFLHDLTDSGARGRIAAVV